MIKKISARNMALKLWAERGKGLQHLAYTCPECLSGIIRATVLSCGITFGFCGRCKVDWFH